MSVCVGCSCVVVCNLMCDVVWFGLLWFCVVVYALCGWFHVFVSLVVSYLLFLFLFLVGWLRL